VYHAISGDGGYFEIALPEATYSLVALPEGELAPDGCPAVVAATSVTSTTGVNLFFPAPPCFELETWVCMINQRRCGFTNSMSVYYSNPSGETADNVQLTLELDPFYTDIVANFPVASQEGNVLTFDIGTLPPYTTGSFWVTFQISCESEFGQTHCVRSLISPAGFCNEDGSPGEALVNITEAGCEGDSIAFRVRNIGEQIMSIPLEYVVVEDGIMMRTNPFVQEALAPGEIFDIVLPATGATYQVTTNQEPGVTVENDPSWALEGCTTSPGTDFTTGLVNIETIGNGVPWEDLVCRQNTGSFDPNDKYGYPLGYDGGQIEPGTRIDYDIRFQNTGTDTAFTVVIRDTLTEALDISTLKMEGGSPDYTNLSHHEIATEPLPNAVRYLSPDPVTLNVFPNPVTDELSISVPDREVGPEQELIITDLTGREVARNSYAEVADGWSVQKLEPGYYLLVLLDENGLALGRSGFVRL